MARGAFGTTKTEVADVRLFNDPTSPKLRSNSCRMCVKLCKNNIIGGRHPSCCIINSQFVDAHSIEVAPFGKKQPMRIVDLGSDGLLPESNPCTSQVNGEPFKS